MSFAINTNHLGLLEYQNLDAWCGIWETGKGNRIFSWTVFEKGHL